MDFPLIDLLDEEACYEFLVEALHPGGLTCPACGRRGWCSRCRRTCAAACRRSRSWRRSCAARAGADGRPPFLRGLVSNAACGFVIKSALRGRNWCTCISSSTSSPKST